ncbi:MAG: FeoB-associated Cys-rich membrane protein [Flavobacteriaceae bacterium]|nr:FeoB-associated Cys-rich membrane protein [Flavobacteriaceae bacterium]
MVQEIIAFIALGLSLVYLTKKFFFKKNTTKNCGPNNCGCH